MRKDQFGIKIDSGISQAVKGADKISMVKNIFGSDRIETTLTTEKTTSFKRNTIAVWPSYSSVQGWLGATQNDGSKQLKTS